MSKFTRQLSIVTALLVLFGGAFMFRFFANQKEPPKKKPIKKVVLKEVATIPVTNTDLTANLDLQGRLVAFDKIDIFAEVQGKLIKTDQPFKKGSYFPKGSVLLQIENSETQLNLLSQKAALLNAITMMMPDLKIDYPESFDHWKKYLDDFDVKKPLPDFPSPLNEKERFFVAAKNIESQFFNIKSQEERLSKYTVYAPFSGVITAANITPGSLVRAGQKMGELMNTSQYELEATVRLADLEFIRKGNQVTLFSNDLNQEWSGKVRRISDQIDPKTQTVLVYIHVNGKNLREGMYLQGRVASRAIPNAFKVSSNLIVNQNEIFTITPDTTLKLVSVEIVSLDNDVAVVKGLENGSVLLKDLFPGAYNGQKVSLSKDAIATN
ncbi:MAG: HlyD family efflux transporter periplasmic adaptor subunit [Bacteroidota bacterium]